MAGRGRLSSLDTLPDEARDDLVWTLEELAKRQRTQADILFELNDRLAVKGIEPISKSAFNRASIRTAAAHKRVQESRAIFQGLAPQFTPDSIDESTIILGEFIKTLILELIDDQSGRRTPKDAMELARAFHAAVSAQKVSADRRIKLKAEAKAQIEKAVVTVTSEVQAAGHKVDAAEVLSMIRRAYGVE